jgi:hypothetical protein
MRVIVTRSVDALLAGGVNGGGNGEDGANGIATDRNHPGVSETAVPPCGRGSCASAKAWESPPPQGLLGQRPMGGAVTVGGVQTPAAATSRT